MEPGAVSFCVVCLIDQAVRQAVREKLFAMGVGLVTLGVVDGCARLQIWL